MHAMDNIYNAARKKNIYKMVTHLQVLSCQVTCTNIRSLTLRGAKLKVSKLYQYTGYSEYTHT